MSRHPLASLLLVVASIGMGQEVARPPSAAPATGVAVKPADTPGTAPARPRTVSPEIAANLSAGMPKFAPPKPDDGKPPPDARELDKPRNTIIRLPQYLVEEPKLPVFNEREMLTPKGRLDLAYRRHLGLRFGSFWIFKNDSIALAMLEEEERLERRAEMADLMQLQSIGATGPNQYLQRKSAPIFMRSSEWIDTGGPRK